MNRGRMVILAVSAVCIAGMLAGCADNAPTKAGVTIPESSTSSEAALTGGTSGYADYSREDIEAGWEAAEANYITLQGSTVSFEGSGAIVRSGAVTIALPGVYVISGTWDDGQIIVDLESKGTVQLVLNGVNMNSSNSAPIYVKNANQTIITLQEGTDNFVSDGTQYVYASSSDDEPSAAIFSKDDLTINGSGSLTVHGNFNDGITGKDDLKITGGKLTIVAVDDGIVGRDLLAIQAGELVIEAGGDGMKSTNDEDSTKGTIVLEGGTVHITAGGDGIDAVNSLYIHDGQYELITGGGSLAGLNSTASAKGLKAAAAIEINGGKLAIDSADDSIHSNGSIVINGGDAVISSGDDGIHADAAITLSGGTIHITKSYEGIESKAITIHDGEIHVVASDDGLNVAGGADGSSMNGRRGQNQFSASGDSQLVISGGYLVLDAQGDGLDSNGSIEMSGGTVLVNGPTNSGNGAIDYDGSFAMSGGYLIAAGSSGMAQAPTAAASTQYSVLMYFTQTQQAGTIVSLQSSNGEIIAAFAPSKAYQSIVISSPGLKAGETYTLFTGGTAEGTVIDGLYGEDASYKAGTEIVSFTLTDTITYVNETGVTTKQSFGPGGGGFGGRGQGGGRGGR